ncbi:serine/threonine protein kinase [Trebonia kvetii]|uniref:Serine/threonine protein kinase n=1 Tax=Trebonia kvetii TaxID=2480626 RepID=A0A6P2CAC9_9ACTN|nr:serine/threonine protein kinase [Trebonia kvetii]
MVQPLRRWDPDRIGPYAIIGKLGAGAMGQVFLARSAAGRLVAVKTIRVELAEEAGFRARFAREVAAARRVSGVFTASVIEADADADLPWVATAYVPAPSLTTLVRKTGPLPVPAVRWLAAGCAEALQSIHGAGLLHRDVKPSNVLVAPDGPRVIDFGVARAAERVQLTTTRGAAGTPAYMAPEQARDATQASPASDVFSLGATLVYAATGHPPYRGETVMDILVRLATEPPDLTGMPKELDALITACLERVPRDRPTDSAILGSLGSFSLPSGPGHSYLPESAMTLIAEYQNSPVPPAGAGRSDFGDEPAGDATDGSGVRSAPEDATSGSHTALPGFHSLDGYNLGRESPDSRPARVPVRRLLPGHAGRTHPGGRGTLPTGIWAAVAIALLGAGIGLGLALQSGEAKAPGSSATLGPAASPLPCATTTVGTTPEICLSQPMGDGDTVYIIHGTGYRPFTPVTVGLAGHGVSSLATVTDLNGTFNYAVDQGHIFFKGLIPPGTYQVFVTAAGEPTARASFLVNAGALHPPPPGGSGPPPA